MSSHDIVRSCEDLLASLSAAETHLRVLCALQMDFGDVLEIYRSTASLSRELLGALGMNAMRVAALSELGGRDNTDELLDLAVLGALGDPENTDERARRAIEATPAQDTGNAPSIPYDDGPEGTADDAAPLLTDEESVEISDATSRLISHADEGDVMVMEEDDWDAEPSADDMKATDVMSLEDAQALVRAAVDAEDSNEQTEPHSIIEDLADNEKTVIASANAAVLVEDDEEDTQPKATPPPSAKVAKPKVKAAPAKKAAKKEVSTNFYAASAAIPTIRDDSTAKPRAAAIRLGGDGETAEVLGAEDEDEPIAVGGVEDEDDLDMDSESGLTLELEEEWDDEAWEDDDEEEEEELMELSADHLEMVEEELRELATLTDTEVDALITRAKKAAHLGNYEAGVNYYSDVLDADPDHAGAYLGRGRLYLDRLDYSRAMSDFTVAEDLAPEDPEIQVAFGDLYFARKDYRKAIDHFDAALGIKEDHAMAFCRRGISHYYRRNYKDAFGDLQHAMKLNPEIPNIKHWFGQAKKKAARSK